jgi:hypothetical protein
MRWETTEDESAVLIGEGPMIVDDAGNTVGVVLRKHAELAASAPQLLEALERLLAAPTDPEAQHLARLLVVAGQEFQAKDVTPGLRPQVVLSPAQFRAVQAFQNREAARRAGLDPDDPLGERKVVVSASPPAENGGEFGAVVAADLPPRKDG